ncbi:MAG: hypothetical protein IJS73_05570 [Paludibacteraceae bacterium]|nr:hypothetical protein [Paludibacteraceae bacterium]
MAEEVADAFLEELKKEFIRQIGEHAENNPEYPKLITEAAYDKCARWANSSLNDTKENYIPERTFFRYKDAIEELFDIEIACDRSAGGLYYIAYSGYEGRTRQWLLSQFAVQNSSCHLI